MMGIGHIINGGIVKSTTGNVLKIINPATGDILDEIDQAGEFEANEAVESAKKAFLSTSWRKDTNLRARVLLNWAYKIEKNLDELSILLTKENGKTLLESKIEIKNAIDTLKFVAGQARLLEGRSLMLGGQIFSSVIAEPAGVVAIIVPWNWPILLMIRELGPALAAGNTVVVKPASNTPLTCSKILQLAILDDEIPKGVINSVIGQGNTIGSFLVTNKHTRVISFTGSTEVGKTIASLAGNNIKKVILELGGKSPSLLFNDANLEKAIPLLVKYMFGTAGQNCMAVSRVLIEKEIFNKVQDLIISEVKKIRVGNGLDPNVQMGPVISKDQLDKIAYTVNNASLKFPDNLVYGGFILQDNDYKNGFFYNPTIFSKVPIESDLVQTEIFGPVVSLEIFDEDDQAIEMANATQYGLTASIWTSDHNRALYCASNIQAGTVWINTYMRTFPETESGGMKQSGIGRSRGKAGIYEYMELKNIVSEIF